MTSTGDIFLKELSGNLHAKAIHSENGDVSITVVAGSLIDANRSEDRDERSRDQLLSSVWQSLNLTAGSGAQDKIDETLATFAASKTRDYQMYWEWRNRTADPSIYDSNSVITLTAEEQAAYEEFYTSEGQTNGLSGTDLTNYVAAAIGTLNNSRTTQYHTLHTEFAAYDRDGYAAGDLTAAEVTDFAYLLSAEQDSTIRGSIKVWTEDELLYTIGAGLLKEVTDTQTTIEDENIYGRDVTVVVHGTSGSGNIGSFSAPVTIDVRPRPLNLTTEERVLLAAAERADVVFIGGTPFTGQVTFTPDAINGDTLTRENGSDWADDGFEVGEYIRIEGFSSNTTPLRTFWEITDVSGSVLTLAALGQVVVESGRTVKVTPVVLDPNAPGANVSFIEIGQRDDVDVTVSGTLSATADGVLFIGSETDLTLTTISAGSDATIKTGGAIISGAPDTSTVVITADNLILEASSGGIGTLLLPLLIDLQAGGTLTARAEQSVVLKEDDGDMNVETIYSQQGDAVLTTANGSMLDQLSSDLTNIKAVNITLNAGSGSIGASGNLLDIDQGPSGILNAVANGSISLFETLGDMRVVTATAATGDVLLKSQLSIVDGDTTPDNLDVSGNHVTLIAVTGGIGGAGQELEINSSASGPGSLTLSSLLGNAYLTELTGDLLLKTVGTGNTSTIFISAPGGKILDGRTDLSQPNIISGKVYLFAAQDIGSSTAPITTQISNVEGRSTTGSAWIENTGHLTVGGVVVGPQEGFIISGDGNFTTHSPITITTTISASGDLTFTASEAVGTDDDITITGTGSVTSTGGKVTLNAGDDVDLQSGSSISAADRIAITSGYTDGDTNGSTVVLNGSLTAPLIDVHATEFGDNISVGATASVTGVLVIVGNDGADTITTATANSFANPIVVFGDSAAITYDEATHVLTSVNSASSGSGAGDTLTNTGGMALMVGGAGSDTINGGTATDWAVGDEADVTFTTNRTSQVASAGNAVGAADTISVGDGTNLVIGGMAGDQITAGTGTNTILGDEGTTQFDASGNLTLAESTNAVRGAADTFTLGSGTYRVIAGAGDEDITLGSGTNYVIGDAGRIRVNGDGTTTIESTDETVSGADTLTVSEGYNVLIGGSGIDDVTVQAGGGGSATAIVIGDNGSLTLSSSGDLLSITSLSGDTNGAADTISLTSGTNAVIGGAGADQITAGGGTNTVIADDGEAQFFADGSLRLIQSTNSGNGANDTISLQDGTNTVVAGAGADQVTLGGGSNFVLGDEGRVEVLTDGGGVPTGTTEVRTMNAAVGGADDISIGAGFNVVIGGAAGDTIETTGSAVGARGIVLGDNGRLVLDNSGTLLSAESTDFANGAADT
ncbi:MAG: calcium-binding protein, partial [Planctomycetaceae bacterium]|nr:calcium-binding protein [Planctomycetaceae bacterium]